jgi:ABC-type nitrate/sulfonate/bicarbonate transport system ATPase subunit
VTTAQGTSLLRMSSLSVRRDGAEVLHDVNLEVAAGEVLAVLGPNGAGKSTLLAAVGNLLAPTSGSVERNGRVATAMQSPDLARRTARANVELALAWWGVPRRQRRERATAALAMMRAEHLADRPALAMSGGEQRRVHIARALAIAPDLLLLDEPFAGLDAETRAVLLDDTSTALRAAAGAVLLVVHDRAEAWALADRLVVLLAGRVVADGRPHDVLEAPPTAPVARFLGFNGELRDEQGVLLVRPSHVHIDPAGDIEATVRRLVPVEDGMRAELAVPGGVLWASTTHPGPSVGDTLRVRIDGGVRYPVEAE